jgi:hypothetical protein
MDFQSSVVDIDEVTKQISVTVPQERVSKEYEASVSQVSRTAKGSDQERFLDRWSSE